MSATCLFAFVSVAFLWHCGNADMFSALTDMEELLVTETSVIANLEAFIAAQEQRLDFLRSRLRTFKFEHERASTDIAAYLSNPMNAFQMTKRLTSDWRSIVDSMRLDFNVEFNVNITDDSGAIVAQSQPKFPTDIDLNGAAVALVRLQQTYQLDTASVASGFLDGVQYSSPMSADDCFELGKQLHLKGDLYHSSMWMQEAMQRLKTTSPTGIDILNYLVDAGELESVQPPSKDPKRMEYERLCRSGTNRAPIVMAPLRCRYVTNRSAFLRIAPLKLEEASLEPYIVIYHQVVYDAEIELIKSMAKPRFARATVHGVDPASFVAADYRISKTAWLKDHEHDRLATLVRRVEDISGLTAATAEELQVVNYGIGGHYEPHLDFLHGEKPFERLGTGNRIATVLFYVSDVVSTRPLSCTGVLSMVFSDPEQMSDVAMGGATVFPLANVAVQARKGTAAVWMNLYKSGVGDERTLHAACPVLLGSKWVCNKWLHEAKQDNLRPCGLEPDHPK